MWKNPFIKYFFKIKSYLINAENFNVQKIIADVQTKDCLIIDNYQNNIDEKEFYSIFKFFKAIK